ncbi:DNA-binding transcriptional regulator, AcrR family [Thermomonospora echinospora]|uniref:DNA-binding transcriptional regulator, AcrR family n=1 Tax=Thermomonospora echinospora TaxID=1992 RepID=A0A1H6D549_9ACTN|nr:TetR/AcrR family transcriptional regulator [Thermomonospora echinospora]SEG80432.1 DNA-binding transcriptional regulator, AcrR family [Thermomonospora echinospora]
MPRRRSLTHVQIAEAALAVIDRAGLDGLSMRVVARELGVSTMALYRYVEDREHLEGLVVDHMLASVDVSLPADLPWQERVAVLLERMREAVGAHPAAVPLTVVHRHAAPNLLRCAEALLGVLTEAGFTGRGRAVALRALLAHVIGALALMHLGPLAGQGTAAMGDLPVERYPHLADTARRARQIPPDEEFRRGLDIVLCGLAVDGGAVPG